MSKSKQKFGISILVIFYSLAGFTSSVSAESSANVDNADYADAPVIQRAVVFGKFRLMKNGNEVQLGQGLFGNSALLRLYRASDQEEVTSRVGKNGEFSAKLAPGDYYLTSIAFQHQGETIEPETNFVFSVSADHHASYVGTITLETTFGSSYNGMKGSIDRIMIGNDCATDCAARLEQFGMANNTVATALPHWEAQVSWNR